MGERKRARERGEAEAVQDIKEQIKFKAGLLLHGEELMDV